MLKEQRQKGQLCARFGCGLRLSDVDLNIAFISLRLKIKLRIAAILSHNLAASHRIEERQPTSSRFGTKAATNTSIEALQGR